MREILLLLQAYIHTHIYIRTHIDIACDDVALASHAIIAYDDDDRGLYTYMYAV